MASRSPGSSPAIVAGGPRSAAAFRRLARAAALAAVALAAAGACVVGTPPWVAPGVRILYRAEGAGRAGIRFLVARKGNEIALTRSPGASAPSYDRHSGWVFFAAREGGTWDLYRVRLSGEELSRLTQTPGVNERWPVPSPDGSSLFFTSDSGGADQIYRGGLDGSDATALSSGPEPHSRAVVDSSGSSLVALEGRGEASRLVRIDAVSGAVTPVQDGAAPPAAGRASVRNDGSIVYECLRAGARDLCRIAPGEAARPLTDGAAEERDPAWSPDGASIVFSSNRKDGDFELYVMRADGSKVRRLTEERGADGEPFWVP